MAFNRVLITGAGGFVGTELVSHLLSEWPHAQLILLDQNLSAAPKDGRITALEGNLSDPNFRRKALEGTVDCLFHLATVPGGAGEADRGLSRRVNLDASLDLFDEVAGLGHRPRIVFTSTIAVLPAPPPPMINDDTKLMPFLSYGAHKLMCEVYLADLHRRHEIEAISVRLPGIVARPKGPSGMKSAFISNMFHAAVENTPFVCPTTANGHIWAMSIETIVKNLTHAALVSTDLMPETRVATLPALRFSLGDLAKALGIEVTFDPDPVLESQFAAQPPLVTAASRAAGFFDDGSLTDLVKRALDHINRTPLKR